MGERRIEYRVLMSKPKGRRPFGIPKHRWEDSIKMGLLRGWMGAWTGLI
jgi:hypothetical protein